MTILRDIVNLLIKIFTLTSQWKNGILGEDMKPSNSAGIFLPFKDLKKLLDSKSLGRQSVARSVSSESNDEQADHRPEHALFKEAMADVKRISRTNCAPPIPSTPIFPNDKTNPANEPVTQLKNLVKYGIGFVVSLTPEYVEGTAYNVNPEVARRLHRGEFSIQDHIDLHGLRVDAAHEVIDDFLKQSIISGKRAVLIIHGRGLSSPAKPILKSKVYRWLTTSPWHKWVIAFASARLCDGGAGATYVLLRQKPLTKRFRKAKIGH